MPRIKTEFESNISLDAIDPMGDAVLIPAEMYLATVLDMKYSESFHRHKVTNPDHPRGFQKYAKLTPRVMLQDETILERQQLVLGVLDEDGMLFRPQEDGKSPIWGGEGGALFMLVALGLMRRDAVTNKLVLDADTDDIKDQVVRIKTSFDGYVRGRSSWDSERLCELLVSLNDGTMPAFEMIPACVLYYNTQKCGSVVFKDDEAVFEPSLADCKRALDPTVDNYRCVENSTRLKIQTCITDWYRLTEKDVEENDLYADGLKVFNEEPITDSGGW